MTTRDEAELIKCAWRGDPDEVSKLVLSLDGRVVMKRARPSTPESNYTGERGSHKTPLEYAIKANDVEAVRNLLKTAPAPRYEVAKITIDGKSTRTWAAKHGYMELAAVLSEVFGE